MRSIGHTCHHNAGKETGTSLPYPDRRGRLSPDELARLVAEHLAENPVRKKRFSVRNSVLVGRLISGAVALVTAALLVLGTFAGVNWVVGGPAGALPGQDSGRDPTGVSSDREETTSTIAAEVLARSLVNDVLGGRYAITSGSNGPFPALPPPVTTPISTVTSTASASPPTSSSVTTSSSSPTTPTTSTPPTTTTAVVTPTLPTTSTTMPATTTTEPTTTTTCRGNNGSGNGDGNCGLKGRHLVETRTW